MHDEIRERLRTADLVPTPDLRDLIDRKLAVAPLERARSSEGSHRRGAFVVAAAALAASIAVVAIITSGFGWTGTDEGSVRAGGAPAPGRSPDASWLVDDGAMSCVERFTPATLADRDHAFAGTITRVEVAEPGSPDGETEAVSTTRVTFRVDEWFAGGSGDSVTLRTYAQPGMASSDETPEAAVGARLLVSGDAGFLWGCGFTQPYSAEAAQTFASAFDRGTP